MRLSFLGDWNGGRMLIGFQETGFHGLRCLGNTLLKNEMVFITARFLGSLMHFYFFLLRRI